MLKKKVNRTGIFIADFTVLLFLLPATIAASFGFIIPAGTPPNSMVFSSGYALQKDMIKAGLIISFWLQLSSPHFLHYFIEVEQAW